MSNRIVDEKRTENRWILPIAVNPIEPELVRNMKVATTEISMIVMVMNNGGNNRLSISFLDVSGRYSDGTMPTNDRMIWSNVGTMDSGGAVSASGRILKYVGIAWRIKMNTVIPDRPRTNNPWMIMKGIFLWFTFMASTSYLRWEPYRRVKRYAN